MKSVPLAGLLVTVGLLAAGCGTSPGSTASAGAPTTAAASANSTTPAATTPAATGSAATGQSSSVTACRSAGLQVSLGGGAGAGMSQNRLGLQLRNTGSTACTLYGYPGVSWVAGPDGQQIGAPASRQREETGSAEKVITLAPGAVASAPLDIIDAAVIPKSECKPVPVRGLRIYPPGERAALFLPNSGGGSVQYGECSLVTRQPTLIIGYLQPGVQPGGGDLG